MTPSEALQTVLRVAVGRQLGTLDGPLYAGFRALADGLALAGRDGFAAEADETARVAMLAEMAGIPMDAGAQCPPDALEIAMTAAQEAAAAAPTPPASAGPVVEGPDLDLAEPLTHEIGGGNIGVYSYRLFLKLDTVTRVRLTDPIDDADEIRVAAGTSYGRGGTSHPPGWRHDFPKMTSESQAPEEVAANKILADCTVPAMPAVPYFTTILLTEEDWAGAKFSGRLATVLSLVLGVGVVWAVRFMTSHGLPADMVEGVKELLEKEGIEGSRDWFEKLIGPELFEVVVCKAITTWAGGATVVKWRGWIAWEPDQTATNPGGKDGPGVLKGRGPLTVREMKVSTGQDGKPSFDVLSGKGQHRMTLHYELKGLGDAA